jgi:ferredoxin-NADP reductase
VFGLLKTHRLIFEELQDVGGGVSSFAFRPERPVSARAGQHGFLRLSTTAVKPFSLASAPEEGRVMIGTSLTSESTFKKRMASLKPGDAVTLRGPINKFTLDEKPGPVVMLAQGVGITPMRSMLAHIALKELTVNSSLIHVADAGHAYRQDTEQWATSAAYPHHADEFRAMAAAAARAHPDSTFYVAGASPFVSSTAALLRDSGIANSQIREDKYLFYKPRPPTSSTTNPT